MARTAAGDLLDLAVQWAASADDDTVSLRFGRGGLPRTFDHLALRQEVVSFDRRRRNSGLRAVMAIFLAGAALGILQHLQAHGLPKVP